jgi:hypothetical protein
MGGVYSIAAAIVGLGLLFTAVSHDQTAQIIKAVTEGFSGALKAAMGR